MQINKKSKNDFKFDESKIKHSFAEKSEFSIVFPNHRVNYLKSVQKFIKKACEQKKIDFEIDFDQSFMKVSTNSKTRDPYIIIKADEFIQLLSRGMTLEIASKVLEENIFCEIIQINMLVSSDTFENRKKRLSNPKVIKALELLTKTDILICGKVACAVGSAKGIDMVKKVIVKCFEENIHPAYEIKSLILKKKLFEDKVEGSWDRFIPKVEKKHIKTKVKSRKTGGMPSEISNRKEDLQMETGEYFESEKFLKKKSSREARRLKRDKIRSSKEE